MRTDESAQQYEQINANPNHEAGVGEEEHTTERRDHFVLGFKG
jgi:hypothetical protein